MSQHYLLGGVKLSRQAREPSPSGIYHVMTRGINKIDLFHEDKDRFKYYDILRRVKEKYPFKLHAYCLMTNHVHLLVEEDDYSISQVMKSIGIRYSMYFNKKNQRVGMLFQNRFRSETIDSENQFCTCARYIHNNPVKAGIASLPEEYSWSSYLGYVEQRVDIILDSDMLLSHFGQSRECLQSFTWDKLDDQHMDFELGPGEEQEVKDLQGIIQGVFGLSFAEVKSIDKARQKMVLQTIKANTALSYRKLADLLGISKDVIYRA